LRLSLRALKLDPADDEANYQAATVLFWNKDYRSSLAHLKELSAQSRAQVGAQALFCADTPHSASMTPRAKPKVRWQRIPI